MSDVIGVGANQSGKSGGDALSMSEGKAIAGGIAVGVDGKAKADAAAMGAGSESTGGNATDNSYIGEININT